MRNKDEKILAISEYKEHIYKYIIQNNLKSKDIDVYSTKDRELFDTTIIQNEDLILEEYADTILLRKEVKLINNAMREEIYRLNSLIEDLKFITDQYNIKKSTRSLFNDCINELIKISKPRRLSILTGLDNLLFELAHMNDKSYAEYFDSIYTIKFKCKS